MFSHLKQFAADLPHASVQSDVLERARQRSFIVWMLIAGVVPLLAIPVLLATHFQVSPLDGAILACLALQAPIALVLARTGRVVVAQISFSLSAIALVAASVVGAGAALAPALIWLVVILTEAILSGRRAALVTCLSLIALAIAGYALVLDRGLVPVPEFSIDTSSLQLAAFALAAVHLIVAFFRAQAMGTYSSQAIAEREERFQTFTEALPDAIATFSLDASVHYVGPSIDRCVGLSRNELTARSFFNRVNVGDRPAILKALANAQEDGEASVEFRFNAAQATGKPERPNWVWLELKLNLITRFQSNLFNPDYPIMGAIRDVSSRKALEVDLERARAEAEDVSRAKTKFLANVTHELRTPLNAVIGFSEILKQELYGSFESDKQREYVQLINDSGEHLLQMVNEMLDMARIETGNFELNKEPFDLTALALNCCQMMGPEAAKKDIHIVHRLQDTMPLIQGDRRACRQILLNLIHNAIKFSEDGMCVEVSVAQSGAMVIIKVRDTGIGIAEDVLPHLGQPFVQANGGYDRQHQGAGLGLSVVRGLAELHEGKLSIKSKLGEGTEVSVLLPLGELVQNIQDQSVIDLNEQRAKRVA